MWRLVLLPFEEDEDSSDIQVGICAGVRGSHRHGETRQVSKQITLGAAADAQQGGSRRTVTSVLRVESRGGKRAQHGKIRERRQNEDEDEDKDGTND